MTSPRRIEYTQRARLDIRDILRYTRKTWGEHQRDVYASKLSAGFDTLAHFPELGEARVDLSSGLFSRRVEHYIVYYRFTADSLMIVRLRHVRADPLGASEL